LVGIVAANVLCYYYGYGLNGIWLGWNIGIIVNFTFCLYYLNKKYQEYFSQQKREMKQMFSYNKTGDGDDVRNNEEQQN
jgi:hypothetical protein